MQDTRSLAEKLAADPAAWAEFRKSLTPTDSSRLLYDWRFWGRPKQQEPEGDWWYWLILAGRGFGKTRTGAEWVNVRVQNGAGRVALVGETTADVRDVMVDGPSGVVACSPPWNRAHYEPSKRRVTWDNGASATTYSAEEPDQLRGPEHDTAWADELAKWRYTESWDNLLMGMRRPNQTPRVLITTTPRPTPIIKDLVKDKFTRLTRGSTLENRGNLHPAFLTKIFEKFGGTRLGRQELDAEVLDDAPGALWKRDDIEAARVSKHPPLVRIVVAVDPSVSSDSPTAATGIIAAGLGEDGFAYVLGDDSLEQPTPLAWATQTVATYNSRQADKIVAEVNNGGDLVETNILSVQKHLPVLKIRASRGKHVRAEPVASLYERGPDGKRVPKVRHVGTFPKLEDELCQWEPGVSAWSPNRLDALVWAITELMLDYEIEDASTFSIPSKRGR